MSENCSIIDIFTGSGRVVGNPDRTPKQVSTEEPNLPENRVVGNF
jgi:hypothetical protein